MDNLEKIDKNLNNAIRSLSDAPKLTNQFICEARNLLANLNNQILASHDLEKHLQRIQAICQTKGWKKDWANGGVYLHLEVSEFIEALRGKGG